MKPISAIPNPISQATGIWDPQDMPRKNPDGILAGRNVTAL